MKFDRSLFIGKFSAEAEEHLRKLNDGVLHLERGEADADLMAEILRAAHTLKGSARMMGFKEINQVAHKLEDLLLEIKEDRLEATQPVCDLIFQALDSMDASRQAIVEGREDEVEVQQVVDLLERTAQGEPLPAVAPATRPPSAIEGLPPSAIGGRAPEPRPEPEPEPAPVPAPELAAEPTPPPLAVPPTRRPVAQMEEHIRVSAIKLDKAIRLTGEVIAAQKRAEMRQADLYQAWQLAREHLRHLSAILDEEDPQVAHILGGGQELRDYLDRLVKQYREDVASLGRVVMELQEDALGLRMLPVSTVFDTFPRAVRDLARERGKELGLIILGGETELDKQMLERISDPLMHMLRNAADHGIETPEEREALGKPRRGTIWLRAYPMGGSIVIEVQDNGRGISLDAIRARALERGWASEDALRSMSDREVQSLIFLSGFSTSRTVSDISGRGVGLDVVRRNIIEELKGDISVETEEGKGTRFILTLPLTLTTQRILFLRVREHIFGLPVTYVAETTRVLHDDVIQVVDRHAIRLRDQIVPIARLAEVLDLPRDSSSPTGLWLYLVIAQVADERVGFVVDEVVNQDDVLIKSLPSHMKRIGILAGATISPDGTVIPILHTPGLIRAVRGAPSIPTVVEEEAGIEAAPRILVVDDSLNTREIEKSILEASGYQVDLAKDGMDALRVLEQAPGAEDKAYYDLLIVDVEMPRMDGLSLTEKLRQDHRYARVPIVIVSSRDKEEDRQRGLAVGADAYIVKGTFDQEDLTTTVASLLGRPVP
jgi:two-component system chemotaxis sensor kinase CheA